MAATVSKLLNGEVTCDDIINASVVDTKPVESEPGKVLVGENLTEFVPFLLNYLRDKTSCHMSSRQSSASPLKNTTPKNSTSVRNEQQKNCTNGMLLSQQTPSPVQVSQNRKDRFASPTLSPHTWRKSPADVRPTGDRQNLKSLHISKIDLDDPEDFPPVGASTPSNKGRTPRRITPTPVKEEQSKRKGSPSPFSSGSLVLSPMASGNQSSSFQEERNMIKLIRSKGRSKGISPLGGVKTPPCPVFGDFIVTSSPRSSSCKSLESLEEQSLVASESKADISSVFSVGETSRDRERLGVAVKKGDVNQAIVSKELVRYRDKLQVLANVYSLCITENLVPNPTAELYFVVQLLTAKGWRQTCNQEDTEVQKEAQQVAAETLEQNILASIHNCVFFAVAVLAKLERIVSLLDKGTLHLLAGNPRVAEFQPALQQQLQKQCNAKSAAKLPDMPVQSPLYGVPFNTERDNKKNYPSDRAFHNFRKQRDAFYELVREWEDCRNKPGWSVEENMGPRIRSVVHQQQGLANHAHLARLFQAQLIQMCKREHEGSLEPDDSLSSFAKSNPEKFQRLRKRFVAPMSSGGPCPAPTFSGPQEFFKSFVLSAASHSFNRHLMDVLFLKIIELNGSEFSSGDLKEHEYIQNKELCQRFSSCLFTLRILAKFLGFLVFEPYQSTRATPEAKEMRNKLPVQFDVLSFVRMACGAGRLVLTVPWIVEYLSMMDPVAPHLDYYLETVHTLSQIYRLSRVRLSAAEGSCGHFLLAVCLGWLFESLLLPGSSFFRPVSQLRTPETGDADAKITLDSSGFVDEHILYSCCPYLGEIRSVLAEAAAGLSSRTGPAKKITPICADETAKPCSSHRRLQLQLEENFFRIQPEYLKRLSDFIVDRLSANILHQVKLAIIPALLEEGEKEIQSFLEADFPSGMSGGQAKDRCRPRALKIIHSVTDDGIKRALEVMESSSKESIDAFRSLCPKDIIHVVLQTASAISTRLIKEKTSDWIKISLPNIVEKELFTQFDKTVSSILSTIIQEEGDSVNEPHGDSLESTNCGAVKTMTEQAPTYTRNGRVNVIRRLQKVLNHQSSLLAQRSSEDAQSNVKEALSSAQEFFCGQKQGISRFNEVVLAGKVTVELAFILACRTCHGVDLFMECKGGSVMPRLLSLWGHLRDRHVPVPFQSLLSSPHLHLMSGLDNTEVIWTALRDLIVNLLGSKFISPGELHSWFITLIEQVEREETKVDIGLLGCRVVYCCYRKESEADTKKGVPETHTTGAPDFTLLLAFLTQRFQNNNVLRPLLIKCAKASGGQLLLT